MNEKPDDTSPRAETLAADPNTSGGTYFDDTALTLTASHVQATYDLAIEYSAINSPMAQDYVRRVNEIVARSDAAVRSLVALAREGGVILHKWKDAIVLATGHGNWIEFYERSGFKIKLRTAQRWMQLATLTDDEIAGITSRDEALDLLKEKEEKRQRAQREEGSEEESEENSEETQEQVIDVPATITIADVVAEPLPVPLRELDELLGQLQDIQVKDKQTVLNAGKPGEPNTTTTEKFVTLAFANGTRRLVCLDGMRSYVYVPNPPAPLVKKPVGRPKKVQS